MLAMAHIGVDLHQNSFTVCRLTADGSEAFETCQLCAADLDRFCLGLDADDEIAVEATGNSAWFRDQVVSCVARVVTVNPRQFQVIRKSVKKTDRNDARPLAFFLSKDMLPETRPKMQAESELTSVMHTRDLLVKRNPSGEPWRMTISAIEGSLPIAPEGPQPDVLAGLVAELLPVVAAPALGSSDTDPARRPVHGAGVARGLDEGLDEHRVVLYPHCPIHRRRPSCHRNHHHPIRSD